MLRKFFRQNVQTGQRIAARLRYPVRRFGVPPILLGNSFPKSGTNLLRQALSGFTRVGPFVDVGHSVILTFETATGRQRDVDEILAELDSLRPGDIAAAHLFASEDIKRAVLEPGYVNYFIYRDPRDVVVSHMHYVTELRPDHVHHRYYTKELRTDEERLRTSILGRPDLEDPFPNIAERFAPYLGWLVEPHVLALKFEDFIDSRAGTLEMIVDHFKHSGYELPAPRGKVLEALNASIDPERSPTFRRGRIGGWREAFTPELERLFDQVAGDLLERLGYER